MRGLSVIFPDAQRFMVSGHSSRLDDRKLRQDYRAGVNFSRLRLTDSPSSPLHLVPLTPRCLDQPLLENQNIASRPVNWGSGPKFGLTCGETFYEGRHG